MRYIGSKTATLPWLSRLIAERAPSARSLCDPFAGTCVVARHFKARDFRVVTGDVLELSYVLQRAMIEVDHPPEFVGLKEHLAGDDPIAFLNRLEGEAGYVTEEFSPAGRAKRRFFTVENAFRIDSIRSQIAAWQLAGAISELETAFLLASLLTAADRVANTAGTYYAYLKAFTRKALLPLRLVAPPTTTFGRGSECHRRDARELVSEQRVDLLYLDPPYNDRDYARYYHLPETIAQGIYPVATGKSGVPGEKGLRSDFYRPAHATMALSQLCDHADARHIVVHYTTDGIIPHESVMEALERRGTTRFEDFAVRAYSANADAAARSARHRLYWCDVSQGGG